MEREPLKIFCRTCRAKLDITELPAFTFFDCPECGTPIRVPRQFGRYLLEKVIGKGGTSVVYRAIDRKLARRAAVKLFREEYADGRDFYAEAKLVSHLEHPAILPVLDCGTFEGEPYLVSKWMEKGDLERARQDGALPSLSYLANCFHAVASALGAASEQSIIHHDVTPANILISAGNEFMLGDFGQAEIWEYGEEQVPCSEWGNAGFLSPERMETGGEDQRGDIFSLGVSMYYLFSGQLPFGSDGSPEVLYRRRADMAFAPLRELVPQIPGYFSALVNTMLAFDCGHRPDYPLIISSLERLCQERI